MQFLIDKLWSIVDDDVTEDLKSSNNVVFDEGAYH